MVEQILHVNLPNHVVEVGSAERKARESAALNRAENFAQRLVDQKKIHFRPRSHNLANLKRSKLERIGEEICLAPGNGSMGGGLEEQCVKLLFGMRQISSSQWASGTPDAEEAKDAVRSGIEQPDGGEKEIGEDHQRNGQDGKDSVRMFDGDVLGSLFTDDDLQ